MVRMMRAGAALVALLVAAEVADAQGGGGGGGRRGGGRGNVSAMLLQNITVTPEIQTKVDTLTAHYQAAQTKLREEYGVQGRGGGGEPPPEAYTTKNTELQNKFFDDIRALLTDEQKKTFDENRQQVGQRGRGRRGGGE